MYNLSRHTHIYMHIRICTLTRGKYACVHVRTLITLIVPKPLKCTIASTVDTAQSTSRIRSIIDATFDRSRSIESSRRRSLYSALHGTLYTWRVYTWYTMCHIIDNCTDDTNTHLHTPYMMNVTRDTDCRTHHSQCFTSL